MKNKNKKEVKVKKEKKEQTIEIGFNVGMESIGEPIDIVYSLAKIYATVES